jgi:hypothetical protein
MIASSHDVLLVFLIGIAEKFKFPLALRALQLRQQLIRNLLVLNETI